MTKNIVSFLLFSLASAIVFSSCHDDHKYDKSIKELDSLKIVVQQSITHFKEVDSVSCYNAYNKQNTYSSFINLNLRDTVSRVVAEDLQTFYIIGKSMVNYLAMRPKWQQEAQMSIIQITNLAHDLKNGAVKDEEAIEYVSEEKKEAEKIIQELNENSEIIRRIMQQYEKSLPTAEDVVKKINSGVLPQLKNPAIIAQVEMD